MPAVYINGRFLSQMLTGVQRFAVEVVRGLDTILTHSGRADDSPWSLVLPPGADAAIPLRSIQIRRFGRLRGHPWEQIELPFASRDGILLNLGSTGPVLHSRQIATIHDASAFANPQNFSLAFRSWYRVLLPLLGRRARRILTVSEFSKRELTRYCDIDPGKIEVVYNGVTHIQRASSDPGLLAERGITPARYVLCVGSRSPNKNIGLIMAALDLLEERPDLVRVGGSLPRVFAATERAASGRVIDIGYVGDPALRALYENALCFVFPSLYEGFGIPPLEAMACGCPVIVAASSALPESCGNAALYCDPHDPRDLAVKLRRMLKDRRLRDSLRAAGYARIERFSWEACARRVYAVIRDLMHT